MYATPPPSASTAAPHAATMPPAQAHGQAIAGDPAAATWNAAPAASYAAPLAPPAAPHQAAPAAGASWITGSYEATGDAAIDRMIRLEAACKRFGSLI